MLQLFSQRTDLDFAQFLGCLRVEHLLCSSKFNPVGKKTTHVGRFWYAEQHDQWTNPESAVATCNCRFWICPLIMLLCISKSSNMSSPSNSTSDSLSSTLCFKVMQPNLQQMLLRLVTHLGDTMDNGKEAPIPVTFFSFLSNGWTKQSELVWHCSTWFSLSNIRLLGDVTTIIKWSWILCNYNTLV